MQAYFDNIHCISCFTVNGYNEIKCNVIKWLIFDANECTV